MNQKSVKVGQSQKNDLDNENQDPFRPHYSLHKRLTPSRAIRTAYFHTGIHVDHQVFNSLSSTKNRGDQNDVVLVLMDFGIGVEKKGIDYLVPFSNIIGIELEE